MHACIAETYISELPTTVPEKQNLVILGSTGSIGQNTLAVVQQYSSRFLVLAIAGARNIVLLAEQANTYRPHYIGVLHEEDIPALRLLLAEGYTPHIVHGAQGYSTLAALPEADTVVCAQVGIAGLQGVYSAVAAEKRVALANKEALVLAGSLLRTLAKKTHAAILPVDSEHCALFHLLHNTRSAVSNCILTASGGPFLGYTTTQLQNITPQEALQHPTWSMGKKISVDSATMMNKVLELVEAKHLFGISPKKLSAVIHPQSLIHALVEYDDNTIQAHLSTASMRLPIANALLYPETPLHPIEKLTLPSLATLSFEAISSETYPCFALAKQVLHTDDIYCIIMNTANEVAVDAFLHNKLRFINIANVLDHALSQHYSHTQCTTLDAIFELIQEVTDRTSHYISTIRR